MLALFKFRKEILILLGNIADHFDTYLYVFLAPLLAKLFFPNSDPVVSLILSYSVLSSSIVTRPFGSYIFSIIAARSNPLNALSYSLMGIGCATMLIGALPSYETIGVAAPILLVMLRMAKGVCAAGESAIAGLYIIEDKSDKPAIRRSYLYQSSTIIGIIFASLVSTLVYYIDTANIWRVFFILGGVASIIGYVLRKKYNDGQSSQKKIIHSLIEQANWRVLWNYRKTILKIASVTSVSQLTYVMPFVVMNYLVPLVTDITLKDMMAINTLMLFFDLIAIPAIGELVSKYKPVNLLKIANLALMITILPIWYFLERSSLIYITYIRIWIVICGIVFLCPLSIWCREQVIETKNKYLVVSMGYVLSSVLVGKLTPSICLIIYHTTGSLIAVGGYFFVILLTCSAVLYSRFS